MDLSSVSVLVPLILGIGFAGAVATLYNGYRSIARPKRKHWADAMIESSFNRVQFAAEPITEQAIDWGLQAFNEMAHQIGESTGHWLQGHHQECEVCRRRAEEARAALLEAKRKQRVAELLSHKPMPGHEFPDGERIIEKSASGEILVQWDEPPRHVESICQTCHDRRRAKTKIQLMVPPMAGFIEEGSAKPTFSPFLSR